MKVKLTRRLRQPLLWPELNPDEIEEAKRRLEYLTHHARTLGITIPDIKENNDVK